MLHKFFSTSHSLCLRQDIFDLYRIKQASTETMWCERERHHVKCNFNKTKRLVRSNKNVSLRVIVLLLLFPSLTLLSLSLSYSLMHTKKFNPKRISNLTKWSEQARTTVKQKLKNKNWPRSWWCVRLLIVLVFSFQFLSIQIFRLQLFMLAIESKNCWNSFSTQSDSRRRLALNVNKF